MTPKIKHIVVSKSDKVQPFIAVGIQLPERDVIIPLDLAAAEEAIRQLVKALGELRTLTEQAKAAALHQPPEDVIFTVGQRVKIKTHATLSGRFAKVFAAGKRKLTLHHIDGLIPTERIQVQLDQVE